LRDRGAKVRYRPGLAVVQAVKQGASKGPGLADCCKCFGEGLFGGVISQRGLDRDVQSRLYAHLRLAGRPGRYVLVSDARPWRLHREEKRHLGAGRTSGELADEKTSGCCLPGLPPPVGSLVATLRLGIGGLLHSEPVRAVPGARGRDPKASKRLTRVGRVTINPVAECRRSGAEQSSVRGGPRCGGSVSGVCRVESQRVDPLVVDASAR
jgi:hypothetical protein